MKLSTAPERDRWLAFVAQQPLPLEVSSKKWTRSRSSMQNALLFGVYYQPIADHMGYEVDDLHEFMCGTHFGWVDKKVPKTPRNPDGIESVPFRTTTRDEAGKRNVLPVADFNRFLGTVERMAARAGVYIPEVA